MSPLTRNGDTNFEIQHLDKTFDSGNIDESALSLIFTLYPGWKNEDGPVKFTRFTDGITNTLLKATKIKPNTTPEENDQHAVLLRAYGKGTEVLIDRHQEARSHTTLASLGLAPPLLATFRNGLIYRFIPGHVCNSMDLTMASVWPRVARQLGEWHARLPVDSLIRCGSSEDRLKRVQNGGSLIEWNVKMDKTLSGLPSPNIWTAMQGWIYALPSSTMDQRKQKAALQHELLRTASDLAHLPGLGEGGLVFSHNDLLSGNVILDTKPCTAVKEIRKASFIDYEYSAPAPAAFDLANHFAEWAGFECIYNQLPTRSQRLSFIEAYLESYYSYGQPKVTTNGNSQANGHHVTASSLFNTVDRFRGVPGLYWGIWALIQATISDIEFDYPAYAERRLGEYWAWRAEEDGSRAREGREMPFRERQWSKE